MRLRGAATFVLIALVAGCGLPATSVRTGDAEGVTPSTTGNTPTFQASPSLGLTAGGPALGGRVQSWLYALVPVDALPTGLTHEVPIVTAVSGGYRVAWVAESCTPQALDAVEFEVGTARNLVVEILYAERRDCAAIIAYGELTIHTDPSLSQHTVDVVLTLP